MHGTNCSVKDDLQHQARRAEGAPIGASLDGGRVLRSPAIRRRRGRPAGPPADCDSYASEVGDRAHQIVGRLLERGVDDTGDPLTFTRAVLEEASTVFLEHPVMSRGAAAKVQAACAAAVYMRRLAPHPPWIFIGREIRVRGARLDLAFRHSQTGQVLIDELKCGIARDEDGALRPQIDRELTGAEERWGPSLAGVRLCAVAAPRLSRFYVRAGLMGVPLDTTAYWDLKGDSR